MKLNRLINVADVERAAARRLPRPVFDLIAGGAGDEVTLHSNRAGFERLRLRPRALTDIRQRVLSTTVLGQRISLPVMLGPAGVQRLASRFGELATARAAKAAGTVIVLSRGTSYPLEDVAAETDGLKWFQCYMLDDRPSTQKLIKRAERAGFTTLVVTIDTTMHGFRERDVRNRLVLPLKIGPRTVLAGARHPGWAVDFVRGGMGWGTTNPSGRLPMSIKDAGKLVATMSRVITYDDLHWIRSIWSGPLVVKGVLRAEDCDDILQCGVDGIIVSNHGGRQLDTVPATIDVLSDVIDAVNGRAEVLIDGGVRRGTDVAKALALGAKAVLIARPYLFGLAVGGQAGIERVLDILRQELDNALGLLGCPSVEQLDRSFVTTVAQSVPLEIR